MREIGRHILAHSLRRRDVARGHDVAFTGKKCAESPLRELAAGRLHVIRVMLEAGGNGSLRYAALRC